MDHLILDMPKRMDGTSLSKTRELVAKAFKSEVRIIVMDFKECDFMDSLGLSVIVTGLKLSASTGKKLRLVNVGKEIRLLLQITRFDRICDIHEKLDSAIL